jgi:hypothetical protein
MTAFADIHCHSTLFPFLKGSDTAWVQDNNVFYPSQADFIRLAKGQVRVVFVSLYPVEQGFLNVQLLRLHTGVVTDFLADRFLSIPAEKVNEIQMDTHDYFRDLLWEYRLLVSGASPFRKRVRVNGHAVETGYTIATCFGDVKQRLSLDVKNRISDNSSPELMVILTIEGGHALGTGLTGTSALPENQLRERLQENILSIKNLGPEGNPGGHCPLFLTISHHFWNQLCGHSVSLAGIMNKLFDQRQGLNYPVTPSGRLAIELLLSKENGRRILIDTKHMPVRAKRWFYHQFLPEWQQKYQEKIPVISSHSAVNGIKTMVLSEFTGRENTLHQLGDSMYSRSTRFNPWDINLSDEEILLIHNSGGLIGLNFDKRIIQGKASLDRIGKSEEEAPGELFYSFWAEPLVQNILHISGLLCEYQHGDETGIWDSLTIGSDLDGMISPLRAFSSAESFPLLENILVKKLVQNAPLIPFLQNKSESEISSITEKILWGNAVGFLEKNFNV